MSSAPRTIRLVAFLRGINVGGHHKVPMADLRSVLGGLGFVDVRTYLASGNAVFGSDSDDLTALESRIEAALGTAFGFPIPVLLRTVEALETLVASDPFAGIDPHPDIRRYITFLREPPAPEFRVPYRSPDGSFRIVDVRDRDVISVLDLRLTRTVDAMSELDRRFGKPLTTRNWNTIVKVVG